MYAHHQASIVTTSFHFRKSCCHRYSSQGSTGRSCDRGPAPPAAIPQEDIVAVYANCIPFNIGNTSKNITAYFMVVG